MPDWPPGPLPPPQVQAFVAAESLPDVRHMLLELDLPERQLLVFRVWFGPPLDCPSGCFFATAVGIQLGSRIGWFDAKYTPDVEPSRLRYFDVEPGDAALFDTAVWDRIAETDEYFYMQSFLPRLALDADTPGPVLLEIATRYAGRPWIFWSLLDNPKIGEHPGVLQILACFPADDECTRWLRQRARDLLGDRFTGCSEALGS